MIPQHDIVDKDDKDKEKRLPHFAAWRQKPGWNLLALRDALR